MISIDLVNLRLRLLRDQLLLALLPPILGSAITQWGKIGNYNGV